MQTKAAAGDAQHASRMPLRPCEQSPFCHDQHPGATKRYCRGSSDYSFGGLPGELQCLVSFQQGAPPWWHQHRTHNKICSVFQPTAIHLSAATTADTQPRHTHYSDFLHPGLLVSQLTLTIIFSVCSAAAFSVLAAEQ